jgi:hypothetical protein
MTLAETRLLKYILVLGGKIIFFILAGYNHLEVAEYLLETGADVNAQDKGGLIPLHNASSYGVSCLLCLVWRVVCIREMSVLERCLSRIPMHNSSCVLQRCDSLVEKCLCMKVVFFV